MPVVKLQLSRLGKLVGAGRRRIVERLPYLGLDIESSSQSSVRVEYSPNRPDFGTDYGIARALRGLLAKEVGLPRYRVYQSGVTVTVDRRLSTIRPHIACATVRGLSLDGEDLRQLLSLQEDLHNGLGRKRAKVAIGLHDRRALGNRIVYRAAPASFRFTPLDAGRQMTIGETLSDTEQGRLYGRILAQANLYPLLMDSRGVVLSFPPIINGNVTKLTSRTREMFIDVTGTDQKAVDDALAILATTLAEMGGTIGLVGVAYPGSRRTTPDLRASTIPLDLQLVRSVTGLDLTRAQAVACIKRCRLDVKGRRALVPRYRLDIIHPVDIAEEVALGYGIDRVVPLYPASGQAGTFNVFEQFLDRVSDLMAASGMVELMTYELVDEDNLYGRFGRSAEGKIAVERPKSLEHSILRDSLLPPLMAALARNIKEDYPQRIYEIGRVFKRTGDGVSESWRLGCLIAHSQSSYTEAKMHVESLVRLLVGSEANSVQSAHWAFAAGRTAALRLGNVDVGTVGEVKPEAIDSFGLKVPASGFEIDLDAVHAQLR